MSLEENGADPVAAATDSPPAPPHDDAVDDDKGPFDFLFNISKVPCFRQSLLWGMGVGTAFGGHHWWNQRVLPRAADAGMKAFVVVAGGSWLLCRSKFKHQRDALKDLMVIQSEKDEKNQELRARLDRGVASSQEADADGRDNADK
jgi:hypothetical protein